MPQKKNPDSLELLRGKSGRIFGNVSIRLDGCLRFVLNVLARWLDLLLL